MNVPKKINATPGKINIFEEKDDAAPLLFIECDCPTTVCNYRCPYCFLPNTVGGYLPFENEFNQWKKTVETAVSKIKRPLILSMGPSGEPLVQPEWWKFFRYIIEKPNVKMATFVTNLSLPIIPLLNEINPNKIGITATLHPAEFKDPAKDFHFFLDQTDYLRKIGVEIAVNYVLIPFQIPDFPKYHKIFAEHGIVMTANLFRGAWEGRIYPEAYTKYELEVIKEYLADVPFIYNYQSHISSPYGNKCTAGRFALNITFDGSVFPCYYVSDNLGSVFDDALYIYDENIICSSQICECKWTIPLQEYIVEEYKGLGNVHGIRKRESNVKGIHPFV